MPRSLPLLRGSTAAIDLARRSRAWDSLSGGDAELTIAVPGEQAVVLGAFQRPSEVVGAPSLPRLRRGSGGGAVRVSSGMVWMQLALARSDALFPCTPDKLLNRYVRPLLRALTRVTNLPVHYFGRDWISAAHRPVGVVSFAHEASTGKCAFEAFVAVSDGIAIDERPSFRGQAPATCEELAKRALEPSAVVDAIASAYAGDSTLLVPVTQAEVGFASRDDAIVSPSPPWSVVHDEAIGHVAAGRDAEGRIEVGGELMASRDAMERLRDGIAALGSGASPDEVGRVVDDAMTGQGAVVFGVRSLASIRDAIVEAQNMA